MNLYEKIVNLYPELVDFDFAFGSIQLENNADNRGNYIAKWEHPTLAKPTDAQLEAAQ